MKLIREIDDLRTERRGWREAGETVGLVPTMGALHAGHMALVSAATGACARVIATIFVNPTQFGEGEDLDAYPDTFDADLARLRAADVDVVFCPTPDVIYPDGFATRVIVDGLTQPLCGATRPGHFDGVTQVVTKLLMIAGADRAYFGEKDWQQLAVVRRLVRDLNIETQIEGVGIVRAQDGLALSSRNAYLTPQEREIAPALNAALRDAAQDIRSGMAASGACAKAAEAILAAGFREVDYLDCRMADDLSEFDKSGPARVFGAAYLGTARLIDNVAV